MDNYMKPLSQVRVTRIARITLIILSGLILLCLTRCNKSANSRGIIHNDVRWIDTEGNEIFCQGGSLCKFGDTFYFYGWADFPGDNRYDKITCYSSKDLATWKFESSIYERNMTDTTLIVPDRLHILYNETTGKYVMIGKHILPVNDPAIPHQPRVTGGVSFFTCSNPTGKFNYLGHVNLPEGTGTNYHRDLSAFKDSDGKAYIVSAHDQHDTTKRNIMITLLSADYLSIERVISEVPAYKGYPDKGKESPYIIKINGKYWLFTSGEGPDAWGSSPTYYSSAASLEGPWSEFRLVLTSPPSSNTHDSQNDFLFEVSGSKGSFVLWGGDRWSQRTPTNDSLGKNVWLPLQWKAEEPLLMWYRSWNIDATKGTFQKIE